MAMLYERIIETGTINEPEGKPNPQFALPAKEIIAGSEAVRKVITSRNPVTRFLVLAVLRTVSFVPALQRQFAKKILYG